MVTWRRRGNAVNRSDPVEKTLGRSCSRLFWSFWWRRWEIDIVAAESFPHVQLRSSFVRATDRQLLAGQHTIPRLHSNVAFRSDWHASGSSSVWFFKHSDGRRPCLRTQSECSRQSLSASRRCVQEEDMDRRQGVRSESADSRRGLWLRARPGSPRARSAASPLEAHYAATSRSALSRTKNSNGCTYS